VCFVVLLPLRNFIVVHPTRLVSLKNFCIWKPVLLFYRVRTNNLVPEISFDQEKKNGEIWIRMFSLLKYPLKSRPFD
jgi:hypothetical protein